MITRDPELDQLVTDLRRLQHTEAWKEIRPVLVRLLRRARRKARGN